LLLLPLSVTHFLFFKQVDNLPPTVSRSGKPIELLPSGPISLIGNNAPSLAALMHRNVRFKKITTRRSKTSPTVAAATSAQAFKVDFLFPQFIPIPFYTYKIFLGYIGCYGNFIGNFHCSTKFHQYSVTFVLTKLLLLHQQTGKSARTRSAQTSADAPQPGQVKRKGPKSTKSQPKRQKIAPSSPPRPVSPIHVELSPSSPEIETQQASSPPQPAPQPQEAPAYVLEQTADPADLIISSVIPPEQTSTAPTQGKVLTIKIITDGYIFFLLNYCPCYFSVDIVPSTTPADQPIAPTASLHQKRETETSKSLVSIFLFSTSDYQTTYLCSLFRNKTL